jgi:exonuclease III
VRLLHWNLLHGGGKRIGAIAAEIARHRPDVVALAEFRGVSEAPLTEALRAAGLPHVLTTAPPPRRNGVALFTREAPRPRPAPTGGDLLTGRWLEATLPGSGLALAVVYVPPVISVGEEAKRQFWDLLLAAAAERRDEPFAIVGDLNTGAPGLDEPRSSLYCSDSFLALSAAGWADAWRRLHPGVREWTWLSKGRGRHVGWGYRLDHAFLSPSLAPRLVACEYLHEPRDAGLSDHSLMLVDLV